MLTYLHQTKSLPAGDIHRKQMQKHSMNAQQASRLHKPESNWLRICCSLQKMLDIKEGISMLKIIFPVIFGENFIGEYVR